MNELKFNSQVCTTKEQSQRLLDLGLEPETADMCIDLYNEGEPFVVQNKIDYSKQIEFVPAWSLHRLLELNSVSIMVGTIALLKYDSTYDDIIEDIEWAIKKGYFNKEYLKE